MSNPKKSLMRATGILIVVLQGVCATNAWSATQVSYKVDLITPQEPLSLEDLMDVDKLGFDCIHEDKIDLAFHATGKGLRLPQTCLPEPCNKALLREELTLLVGRPANEDEWDQYFSRYADVCRKEIPPIATDDGDIPVSTDDPVETFWRPLIPTFQSPPPTGGPDVPPRRPSFIPTFSPPTKFNPIISTPRTVRRIISSSGGAETPSPVPLPGALWMLLTGLGCLAVWKRRQTKNG